MSLPDGFSPVGGGLRACWGSEGAYEAWPWPSGCSLVAVKPAKAPAPGFFSSRLKGQGLRPLVESC
jgi:hypothetical protein